MQCFQNFGGGNFPKCPPGCMPSVGEARLFALFKKQVTHFFLMSP